MEDSQCTLLIGAIVLAAVYLMAREAGYKAAYQSYGETSTCAPPPRQGGGVRAAYAVEGEEEKEEEEFGSTPSSTTTTPSSQSAPSKQELLKKVNMRTSYLQSEIESPSNSKTIGVRDPMLQLVLTCGGTKPLPQPKFEKESCVFFGSSDAYESAKKASLAA